MEMEQNNSMVTNCCSSNTACCLHQFSTAKLSVAVIAAERSRGPGGAMLPSDVILDTELVDIEPVAGDDSSDEDNVVKTRRRKRARVLR